MASVACLEQVSVKFVLIIVSLFDIEFDELLLLLHFADVDTINEKFDDAIEVDWVYKVFIELLAGRLEHIFE